MNRRHPMDVAALLLKAATHIQADPDSRTPRTWSPDYCPTCGEGTPGWYYGEPSGPLVESTQIECETCLTESVLYEHPTNHADRTMQQVSDR